MLAAAILGLLLLASLAGILVMPGVIWFLFYKSKFIWHEKYEGILTNFGIWFFIPFGLPIATLVLIRFLNNDIFESIFTFLFLLTLFVGVIFSYFLSAPLGRNIDDDFEESKRYRRKRKQTKIFSNLYLFVHAFLKYRKHKLLLFIAWLYSIFFGQSIGFPLLLMLYVFEEGEIKSNVIETLSILCFIVVISFFSNCAILYFLRKEDPLKYLKALSCSFLAILIFALSLPSSRSLPALIMRNFGWGNLNNITIIVDYKGCQIIALANPDKVKCLGLNSTVNDSKSKNIASLNKKDQDLNKIQYSENNLYKIDSLKMLLGLGDNYYFELDAPPSTRL